MERLLKRFDFELDGSLKEFFMGRKQVIVG